MKVAVLTTHPCIQFPHLYEELTRQLGGDFMVFMSSDGRYERRVAFKKSREEKIRVNYNHKIASPKIGRKKRFFRYFNPRLLIELINFNPDYIICPIRDTPNFIIIFVLSLITKQRICLAETQH